MLFNASWWWHEVENLTDFTVGCAIRHAVPPFGRVPCWRNAPVMTGMSVYPFIRAMVYAHYLRDWVKGSQAPLFSSMNNMVSKFLHKSFADQERAAKAEEANRAPHGSRIATEAARKRADVRQEAGIN